MLSTEHLCNFGSLYQFCVQSSWKFSSWVGGVLTVLGVWHLLLISIVHSLNIHRITFYRKTAEFIPFLLSNCKIIFVWMFGIVEKSTSMLFLCNYFKCRTWCFQKLKNPCYSTDNDKRIVFILHFLHGIRLWNIFKVANLVKANRASIPQ